MRTATRATVAVTLFTVVALAGCGSDDDDTGPTTAPSTAARPTTESEATVTVRVYFVNDARFETGEEPYVDGVTREVSATDPIQGALDALFDGPDPAETGLSFVASEATGAELVEIDDSGIARVQLRGGCGSGGSTLTIANELVPTLREFPEVTAVKILDTDGATETPDGPNDSIPICLEP
ncbi:MAG: GerMN domain-containing protein [Actinomycetota bacterium]